MQQRGEQGECKSEAGLQELARRKQKRKKARMRQKEKVKQAEDKAIMGLVKVVREMYKDGLKFQPAESVIHLCLSFFENGQEKVLKEMDIYIQHEVELQRQEIRTLLAKFQLQQGPIDQAIKAVFVPLRRLFDASNQVQKFVRQIEGNYKNFATNIFKFVLNADLFLSPFFSRLCAHILTSPLHLYPHIRELVHYINHVKHNETQFPYPSINSFELPDQPPNLQEFDKDDEWHEEEEEISTVESCQALDGSRRKRKERKRKLAENLEADFEAIMKRIEDLEVAEERGACNVTEEWVGRMRQRMNKWRGPVP